MSDEDILKILKSDNAFKQSFDSTLNSLKFLNSPFNFPIGPQIDKTKDFVYYSNFILISEKILKKLFKFDKKISL